MTPIRIRDAESGEASALEALQRRSSDVWEEFREQLAAHPDAIEFPQHFIDRGWTRSPCSATTPQSVSRWSSLPTAMPTSSMDCSLNPVICGAESDGRSWRTHASEHGTPARTGSK